MIEGCRGLNNCFLKCTSASSSRAHTEAWSSWKESVQRIMGARSVNQSYPFKSFILKGKLKWPVLSTSVSNDPSICRPWLFSLDMSCFERTNCQKIIAGYLWSKYHDNGCLWTSLPVQYDIGPQLGAMITEIVTIVSQCQSFIWDSRKSGSV